MNPLTASNTLTEKLSAYFTSGLPASFGPERLKAWEHFLEQGVPGRKNESYKYSPVQGLFQHHLEVHGSPFKVQNTAGYISGKDAQYVLVLNGRLAEVQLNEETKKAGVIIDTISSFAKNKPELIKSHFASVCDTGQDPFAALNTARFEDGIVLYIPDNARITNPVQIVHLMHSETPSLLLDRSLYLIGKNAEVSITEYFDTHNQDHFILNNSVSEIFAGERSTTRIYRVQNDCEYGNRISTTWVKIGADAHFDTLTFTLGGSFIRNNLNLILDGTNIEAHLNGLLLTNEKQHVDNHTLVDHQFPNCRSFQNYKGILGGKSTGVFNGRIFVRKDAQKTNAYQSSKNLLCSDDASMNAKPELEIYADDVKCSHGSSTGRLEEEAMFYLRSRGIGIGSARKFLTQAFLSDVMDTVRIPELKEHLLDLVKKKLDVL